MCCVEASTAACLCLRHAAPNPPRVMVLIVRVTSSQLEGSADSSGTAGLTSNAQCAESTDLLYESSTKVHRE